MSPDKPDSRALEPPLGRLEQALIDEFVRGRGYDPLRLSDLPDEERNALLKQASVYASGRLEEIEARSHFVREIHDADSPRRGGA